MEVVKKGGATLDLTAHEVGVLVSVGGLAGFTAERCGKEYGWTFEDQEAVKAVLLDLFYKLGGFDVPVYHDRRKGRF